MAKHILEGVGEIIDEAFSLNDCKIGKSPHYRHIKSCKRISVNPVQKFDGEKLCTSILKKIKSNRVETRSPSLENWRVESQKYIHSGNGSPEVKLERAIVNLPDNNKWINAVPTSSGLVNGRADKKRNIDLIYDCGEKSFEFIELKVESNTPLYAAMEILQYGILYVFTRVNKQLSSAAKSDKLLTAETIHLRVLAPSNYYKDYELGWLELKICNGLTSFLNNLKLDTQWQMDFRFDAFPSNFQMTDSTTQEQIKEALKDRAGFYDM